MSHFQCQDFVHFAFGDTIEDKGMYLSVYGDFSGICNKNVVFEIS